jgi:hypothetical protein
MVWSDALNADPPSDEGYDEGSISDPWSLVFFCFIDGSDHEDANGHCPDPGIEGDSAVQLVGPAVGGFAVGSTTADGAFETQDGGPASGGPAVGAYAVVESKLACINI